MKKIGYKLTESDKQKLIKRFLNESGIIKYQDTICDIICQEKIAMYGSTGDVVKMIQHLLYVNQFNVKYAGGGMKGEACYKDYRKCDGLFKEETKKAVEEFQRSTSYLKVDGKFGYSTWKEMCTKLVFTDSVTKDMFCDISQKCDCNDFQNDKDNDFNDVEIFNPIEIIDELGCDTLKKCVKEYILKPAPDYVGFESCIGGKKIVNERNWNCELCKQTFPTGYVNRMPSVDPSINSYENYLHYLGGYCIRECGFKEAV